MKEIILVKDLKSQNVLFKHELAEGEKPWLVLESLIKNDYDGRELCDLEFEMKTESGV